MLTNKKSIIVIGDVHGRTSWRQIVDKHPGCRFVFLGDYCDPYETIPGEAVLDNLKEIIQVKQSRPDEVVLLLGNHDVHYTEDGAPIGSRFSLEYMLVIEELLTAYADCFQCAYSEWGILFTHAGVSEAWFRESFAGDVDGDIASQLKARCSDESVFHCGASRGGPHPHGGIYWAGKSEMSRPLRGTVQVVGHTRTDGVQRIEGNVGVVYFCDCLEKGKYLMIDNADIPQFYELGIDDEEKSKIGTSMRFHISETSFYEDGRLCPEPKETLEELETMYMGACNKLKALPREISADEFDENDIEALNVSMAHMNLCSYIDELEWKIDLKILHQKRNS